MKRELKIDTRTVARMKQLHKQQGERKAGQKVGMKLKRLRAKMQIKHDTKLTYDPIHDNDPNSRSISTSLGSLVQQLLQWHSGWDHQHNLAGGSRQQPMATRVPPKVGRWTGHSGEGLGWG